MISLDGTIILYYVIKIYNIRRSKDEPDTIYIVSLNIIFVGQYLAIWTTAGIILLLR